MNRSAFTNRESKALNGQQVSWQHVIDLGQQFADSIASPRRDDDRARIRSTLSGHAVSHDRDVSAARDEINLIQHQQLRGLADTNLREHFPHVGGFDSGLFGRGIDDVNEEGRFCYFFQSRAKSLDERSGKISDEAYRIAQKNPAARG